MVIKFSSHKIVSIDVVTHTTDIGSSSLNLKNIIKQQTRNIATLLYRIALVAIIQLENGNKITSETLEFQVVLIGEVKTLKRRKNNQRVEKDTHRLTEQ